MRTSALAFIVTLTTFGACAVWLPSAAAQQPDDRSLGRIKHADSVTIDCSACPRALANAGKTARQELTSWDRFRIVNDPKKADLIFMFSSNPYLGDYLTRKGPDERPVRIESTIMTVIDPRTGETLWSDSRRWGSLRVAGATRDLIGELRGEMEAESRKWTLDEVFGCRGAAAYQALAFATPEAALQRPELGVRRMDEESDRLTVSSPQAPEFCRRAQLLIGADHKIDGFEVVASEADALDVAAILAQADQFDFTSGKDPQTQKVHFTAQTTDKKTIIRFEVRGRRAILSRVTYLY